MRKTGQRVIALTAAAAAAVAFGGVAWAEGESMPRYTDMYLYGIEHDSGDLVRYDFALETLMTIGPVQDASDVTLTGIEASAYAPGYTNIYGFWTDPSDDQAKLLYINKDTGKASVVGDPLGTGSVTGAVAVNTDTGVDVFVVQVPKPIEFQIINGSVVPSEPVAVKVSVLGAAISAGGAYDVPVTAKFKIGADWYKPFGPYAKAISGNLNDGANPRDHIFPSLFPAGSAISSRAKSWLRMSGTDGSLDDHYYVHMTVDSTDMMQVLTLRDGDTVPSIEPFMDQAEIVTFLDGYVDSDAGVVTLDQNQAIFLLELGTSNMTSSAADFQDLVVLVTLARSLDELLDPDGIPRATLSKVDHETGAVTEVMDLSREYESLASEDGVVFYGTDGNNLYRIDSAGGSETLVGPISGSDIGALEISEGTAVGYDSPQNMLTASSPATGSDVDPPRVMGSTNVRTLVLVSPDDAGSGDGESYD